MEERTAELTKANEQLSAEIAERKQSEKALRQQERLAAVGQLAGGIAHDFNNLLTTITSSTPRWPSARASKTCLPT